MYSWELGMSKYRRNLPQLSGGTFLSDGGMETDLIFNKGFALPNFASFVLLTTHDGEDALRAYYRDYLTIAAKSGVGFILDTPTWRANPDWGALMGFYAEELRAINEEAVELLEDIRREFETEDRPIVINGAIGPRGDAYKSGRMSAEEAQDYHRFQVEAFAKSRADMVTAYTLPTLEEGIGIARAAKAADIPVVVSFTVETDGHLPSGMAVGEAITRVDEATDGAPAYFMINCAHPSHFEGELAKGASWLERVHGIRANASMRSHAELDESDTLDDGDPVDLGRRYRELGAVLPHLQVLGGCCGTDHRHIAAIAEACLPRVA